MATDLTLDALLAGRLATDADSPWLVDDERRMSSAEADAHIALGATRLANDLAPGSRVVVSLPNSVEAALSLFAAVRAGMVWVGIHPRTAPDKVAELTRRATQPPTVDAPGLAVIAFTSGTSGAPKGVMHTEHNICLPAVVAREREQPGPTRAPVIGMYLSLMSINMQILGPIVALASGGSCVCLANGDSVAVASAVQRYGITSLPMAAATAYDWVNGAATAAQLGSLGAPVVGGSGAREALLDDYAGRFGTRLTLGYGLTEAPTSVCREPLDRPRVRGSSGRPLDHLKVTIRDASGVPVAVDAIGEICVEAADARYRPMLGYWNDPAASAAALPADAAGVARLHTGDRGRLDADGFVHVLGRGDEVIVRGGVNVSAEEVEALIGGAPGVTDVAVVGVPDDRLGQVPVAAVVLNGEADAADVVAWCQANLHGAQRPVDVVAVEALERSPMGKLRRGALAARLAAALERRTVEALDVGPAEHRADQGGAEDQRRGGHR